MQRLALMCLVASGCQCSTLVRPLEPGRLVVAPVELLLPPVYVGQTTSGAVTATNAGEARLDADVSVTSPFTVDTAHLALVRGQAAVITVTFAPTQAGTTSGELRVGEQVVSVLVEALAVPVCASDGCLDQHFDLETARCVEVTRPDGSTCETSCVVGACAAGACVGVLKGCDDQDACTIDACDSTSGCRHLPRACPVPTNPCEVASCDVAAGCVVETAHDGTLCGPDVCLDTQVDVCIAGACVRRARPDTGRCTNRWVPSSVPARWRHAMAYDAARQRVVVFSGSGVADTWEWDGVDWSLRTPVASPPARHSHALAWDEARRRVVLFGGTSSTGALADTWAWDGTTWTQRTSTRAPPARGEHAMTWDTARQRLVLFGGSAAGVVLGDTWEWDGQTWTQRAPANAPPPLAAASMVYDTARRRVVLHGGYGPDPGELHSDTWSGTARPGPSASRPTAPRSVGTRRWPGTPRASASSSSEGTPTRP